MGVIALAVVGGSILLPVGLVKRKRGLILAGSAAAAILLWWFVGIGRAPEPESEFARCFGGESRSVVSDIKTIKPRSMNGHFISFHVSQADFDMKIRGRFSAGTEGPGCLLQKQPLPEGWPKWIETAVPAIKGEALDRRIFLVYGSKEQRAFASVAYEQW